jgi:hypothetical protein
MTSHHDAQAAVTDTLAYQAADAPVLADALSSYAVMQRWIVTCLAAVGAEREFAAHKLVASARLLHAAGQAAPDLGPMSDAERARVAASGADPYAIEAMFSRARVKACGERPLAKLEGERIGTQVAVALAKVDASQGGPLLSRLDAGDLEAFVAAAAQLWSGVEASELSESQREVMNRASGQAGALLEAEYRALRDLAEAVRAERAGDTCAGCGRELVRDRPTSQTYDRKA